MFRNTWLLIPDKYLLSKALWFLWFYRSKYKKYPCAWHSAHVPGSQNAEWRWPSSVESPEERGLPTAQAQRSITSPSTSSTKEGGSRDIKRNCINRKMTSCCTGKDHLAEREIGSSFQGRESGGREGRPPAPSPTHTPHAVSIAAQEQTFFSFHKKAWLMFCNYISLHFNQILSALEIAFLFFSSFPPYVTLPNSHPRAEKLKAFFSIWGCPSAASIIFFFACASLCPHSMSSRSAHRVLVWSEKGGEKPCWRNLLN